MSDEKSISELVSDLKDATSAFNEAEGVESRARLDKTTAINRMNNAQKALDAAILALKKEAPRDSDWKQSERLAQMKERK